MDLEHAFLSHETNVTGRKLRTEMLVDGHTSN